jgi:CBS domain-containing protein
MVTDPAICTYLTSIDNIKRLMEEKGVHEVVIVDTLLEKRFLGIIHQDDIVKKSQDLGVDPSGLNAEQCIRSVMTTAPETTSLKECYQIMEYNNIQTLVIVDDERHVCGILPIVERGRGVQ